MGVEGDLLLAHKDLVVVLDETASAVTREDVPGVGVGDGRLPAHLPAHLLPAHLLPAVALLLLPVPLLLPTHLPALLLAAVALLLAATVLHRHGGSRRHNWPHEQCRGHRQGEEERVQHAAGKSISRKLFAMSSRDGNLKHLRGVRALLQIKTNSRIHIHFTPPQNLRDRHQPATRCSASLRWL